LEKKFFYLSRTKEKEEKEKKRALLSSFSSSFTFDIFDYECEQEKKNGFRNQKYCKSGIEFLIDQPS